MNNTTKSNSFLGITKENFFKKRFHNFGYLPRWIIFAIDVIIVFFSIIITHFIITSLNVKFYDNRNFVQSYSVVVIINALFFLLYRTYAGIIRHSTFIDGVKLLVSTTTSYFVLLIINYSWFFVFDTKIFLTTGLFIGYVISFILLFLFRIIVKLFFQRYMNFEDKNELSNALIYGSDANAISVANALRTEKPRDLNYWDLLINLTPIKLGKEYIKSSNHKSK